MRLMYVIKIVFFCLLGVVLTLPLLFMPLIIYLSRCMEPVTYFTYYEPGETAEGKLCLTYGGNTYIDMTDEITRVDAYCLGAVTGYGTIDHSKTSLGKDSYWMDFVEGDYEKRFMLLTPEIFLSSRREYTYRLLIREDCTVDEFFGFYNSQAG